VQPPDEPSAITKPAAVPGMSGEGKLSIVASVLWCLGIAALFSRRTNFFILGALPLVVLFVAAPFIALLCILVEWPTRRWRSLIPLAVFVASILASGFLTQLLRHVIFARTFPTYEKVVERMESGAIPVSAKYDEIPQAEKEAMWVHAVFAEKSTNGVLKVLFVTESGFPARRSGYYYLSTGVSETDPAKSTSWPINKMLRDKWLFVSN